jgi:hypothetical protein
VAFAATPTPAATTPTAPATLALAPAAAVAIASATTAPVVVELSAPAAAAATEVATTTTAAAAATTAAATAATATTATEVSRAAAAALTSRAAPAAPLLLLRPIDPDTAPVDLLAVELEGLLGPLGVGVGDEAEPTGTTSLSIQDDAGIRHVTKFGEHFLEALVVHCPRQAADEQFCRHLSASQSGDPSPREIRVPTASASGNRWRAGRPDFPPHAAWVSDFVAHVLAWRVLSRWRAEPGPAWRRRSSARRRAGAGSMSPADRHPETCQWATATTAPGTGR